MTTLTHFDDDGFLDDPRRWDWQLARSLARRDGLGELSDAHWTVIGELRRHYRHCGGLPPFGHVCHVCGLDHHCLDALFSTPREAWRLAGLPNPGEEAKAYM
ncbi:TusE/DsrC/DsvC family sulfur relay protein [Endothiovibrio diazotrophicus]